MFVRSRLVRISTFVPRFTSLWGFSRRRFATSFSVMQNSFTSPNITVVEGAPKKKRHRPRTIQDLSNDQELLKREEEKRTSKQAALTSNTISSPFKKLDPIDAVNTGTHVPNDWRKTKLPEWKRHKFALAEKFKGQAWDPKKKLSRETMESVRILKQKLPDLSASDLAEHFKTSPEAIRRILKSKWAPKTVEDEIEVMERWKRRKERLKDTMREKKKTMRKENLVRLDSTGGYVEVKNLKGEERYRKSQKIKVGGSKRRLYKAEKKEIRKLEF